MDGAAAATARYAAKKEAVLAAATAVLNRQGVKGMTLADVAAKVGLNTTSVTYYFRKKDDLAAACFQRGLERLDALIGEAAAQADAPARVRAFVTLYLDLSRRVRAGQAPPLASFTEIRSLKEPMRGQIEAAFVDVFRRVRGLLDGEAFARLGKDARNARTHLLLEQVFWTGAWLRRFDLEDYDRVRERMLDILLHGLAPDGRQWVPSPLPAPAPAGDDWRETFLVAATRLINQRGYRGASVEEISAALNVTKGSFYHHHDDKDALVVECFQRTFAVTRGVQLAARALPTDGWDRVTAAASALVAYQLSEPGPLLRASSMGALPIEIRHEMADGYARGSGRFAGLVADGIADGSIRPVDPMIAAHMINAMLNAAAALPAWSPGADAATAPALFARPLLKGLLAA